MKTIDVSELYAATDQAKLADLPAYESRIKEMVAPGEDVTLTGHGPVWLYLRLAHLLHGRREFSTTIRRFRDQSRFLTTTHVD